MIGTVPAEESAQVSSASDELDQKVRIILQNSINTIRNARSYSTYLRCQAIILGKTVNGEGEYYQKRQNSSLKGQETVSARWEMTLKLLPNSRFYQLMILNGEQDRLWMLTERRTGEQKEPENHAAEIQVVDLASARMKIERSPLEYTSIMPPWYSQPNVAQILEGILRSYHFTMGGETLYTRTNQPSYLIRGQMKPELTEEILKSRGLDPAEGLFALPGEVPMYVELMIDKAQGLPLQIRFYSVSKDEKTSQVEEEETFSYTILFEQSHLGNASWPDSDFEIALGNKTRDVTEQYLNDHYKK